MQLGTIEGAVDTSTFTFRATEDVRKFDFVSVKSNEKWILAQVEEVTKHPDGKTEAKASIIGYRDKGLTKAPRRVIEPDSIVYKADQELISDTLGLDDEGLLIGNLETNPDIDIFVNSEDFYKHFAVLAQTGAGKCVVPDTNVLLSDGNIKSIEEIFEQHQDAVVRQNDDEEIVLLSDCSVKCIDEEFRQTNSDAILGYRKKVDNVLKIELESGRQIEVTPEHPLLSAENNHSFIEAQDISEGEHIAIPRKIDTQDNHDITISNITASKVKAQTKKRKKLANAHSELQKKRGSKTLDQISEATDVPKSTLENWVYQENEPNSSAGFALSDNAKGIQVPEHFNEELAEFLSLIIAEGTEQFESSYRIIFTNNDQRLLDRFNQLSKKLFDLETRAMQNRARYIDSTSLKHFLEEIEYDVLQKSRTKDVPKPVLKSDIRCKKRFLQTFYDCEGCMEDHEITLSSASQNIVEKISYMLLEFGIVSRIRSKEKSATNSDHEGDIYYEVVVSGVEQMQAFADKIGFGMTRKQEKLENYLDQKEGNTNTDVVPFSGEELRAARNNKGISQKELGDRIGSHSTLVSLYERDERRPSSQKFKAMAEELGDSNMTKLANSDIFWDKVKSVETIEHDDYVYDLTVRQYHNFIAGQGGIVCHNSYLTGVLIEELLENDFPVLILDPHGEYSSLEFPNPENEDGNARGYEVNEYSPNTDVNSEALPLTFSALNMQKKELLEVIPDSLTNSQMGVLYNSLKRIQEKDDDYTLNDIMDAVSQEESTAKWNLLNSLEQVDESGLFSTEPIDLKNLLTKGEATVVNLRAVEPETTEMTAYLLAKRLFDLRKKDKIPPFVMVLEEAHNFAPEKGFGKTLSNEILRKIASEGRKFGLGMGVISQRPARIDKNVLSQCNTQFILRVTNPNDLKAISKSFEGITSEVESMITSLPPGVSFALGNEYPVMTSVRTRKSKHGGTTQTAEDYEEKMTIEYYEPREQKKNVESRESEKYSIAYYPLYLLESQEKRILIDGVEGDVKAERTKPTGLNAKVYDKIQSGLDKSEILESLDVGLTKFSNIKESLREDGLIKEDSMEPTESVTQLNTIDDNVRASEVIEFEIDLSDVEDRLNGAEISKIYYPYYSKDDKVYDPILKQEVG